MTKIQQVIEENEKILEDEIKGMKLSMMTMDDETAIPFIFSCLTGENKRSQLRLIEAFKDYINLILPLAKGYAAEHQVGSNQKYIEEVEDMLSELEKVVSKIKRDDNNRTNRVIKGRRVWSKW